MDKDFINLIQPNFDYLSGSTIWKNNLNPLSAGNFVAPNFNELYTGLAATTFDKLKLSDNFAFAGNVGVTDFKTFGGVQTDYLKSAQSGLTYERDFLNVGTLREEENSLWHIIDAGVSYKSMAGVYNSENFYTTSAAAIEAGGNLSHFLPSDNITLHSYTPRDFKENNNFVTLTSPFGDVGTVAFEREVNATSYLACGHVAAGTLTNTTTGEGVTICGDVLYSNSTSDFGLAVYGIAFHTTANIFTEDSCLGYAFGHLHSFRPSSNTSWEYYTKIKNNSSCSHNH